MLLLEDLEELKEVAHLSCPGFFCFLTSLHFIKFWWLWLQKITMWQKIRYVKKKMTERLFSKQPGPPSHLRPHLSSSCKMRPNQLFSAWKWTFFSEAWRFCWKHLSHIDSLVLGSLPFPCHLPDCPPWFLIDCFHLFPSTHVCVCVHLFIQSCVFICLHLDWFLFINRFPKKVLEPSNYSCFC